MDNFIEMTLEEWAEAYKPMKNHLDTNASFDGEMFGHMVMVMMVVAISGAVEDLLIE